MLGIMTGPRDEGGWGDKPAKFVERLTQIILLCGRKNALAIFRKSFHTPLRCGEDKFLELIEKYS